MDGFIFTTRGYTLIDNSDPGGERDFPRRTGDNTVMTANTAITASFAYDDLQDWLAEVERLGELETVRGASWEKEIGLATELLSHSETAPCVLFEEVPGCPKGFRLLVAGEHA
jgi:hypothetical protein